jgi:hypothetical protein
VTTRRFFGLSRLAAAALCIVALVHRLIWGLSSQTIAGDNFFAYLTIQSNIAFSVLAIAAGVIALRHDADPAWLTTARAIVLSWTITAGLAFALIVWQAGVRGIRIDVPWSDVVLHFVLPVWTVLSWVLGPGRHRASWRVVPFVLLYPVVWGLFTMWRGSRVGWYPYYFLDLRQVSGLPEFASGLVLISRARVAVPQERAEVYSASSAGSASSSAGPTVTSPK